MGKKARQELRTHRGRLQAQGPDTEESVPWNTSVPPTKREMLAILDQLWAKLTRRQKEDREKCLVAAQAYIRQAGSTGIAAEVLKTFRNRKLRHGVRIDREIRAGRACVDDPEDA